MFPIAAMSDFEAVIVGAFSIGLFVVVPIVSLLLAHQRKMAELVRRPQSAQTEQGTGIARLESEVRDLRNMVHEQAIVIDDLRKLPPLPNKEPVTWGS